MTRCPSCGEQQPDHLSFCDQCGARLTSTGLLMLGASIGADSSASPVVVEQESWQANGAASMNAAARAFASESVPGQEPQRFVPFASRPALRVAE